jgi:tripeptide aminopeptidase
VPGFTSDLARETAPDALERFLRYAVIDTGGDPASETFPSTAKQLDLSRLLRDELRALGLGDAELDEHGYVMATLEPTVEHAVPTIALLAHVDVSYEAPSADVKPQVVRYEGGDLPLPGDPSQVLSPAEEPELQNQIGNEIVTSDGTTLLGADDKAGAAEIMAAVAYLAAHPEIPHGPIRICFTVDEEIGHGVDRLDLGRLGADVAYTLDGSTAGEVQEETFSAKSAKVTFSGREIHPGSAKGVMVNAIKAAADFVASLPRDGLAPETTDEREGFVHPLRLDGTTERATVELILRDFEEDLLEEHEAVVRRLAAEAAAGWPGSAVEVEVRWQYKNLREYLAKEPRAVPFAEEAVRRAGLEPIKTPIRGGTDGSRLSELGLPTPNIFTGGHGYHSRREWVSIPDMGAAVATIVHLVQIWAEETAATAEGASKAPSTEQAASPAG